MRVIEFSTNGTHPIIRISSGESIQIKVRHFDYTEDGVWSANVGDIRHSFEYVPVSFTANMYIHSTPSGYKNYKGKPCGCELTLQSYDSILESIKNDVWFFKNVFPILLPASVTMAALVYFSQN